MKRVIDVGVALFGLVVFAPLLLITSFMIWLQDRGAPLDVPIRVGLNGQTYRMFKLRSMVLRADANQVDSTANDDPRITLLGKSIRLIKLDEVPQLWNVLIGDMSLVGPRPNIQRETDLYTAEERKLLSIRPGITDISSIVFSDLGTIIKGCPDPNLAYNQFVRPWKSRLGILYVEKGGVWLDFKLILLTLFSAVNRPAALARVAKIASELGASEELVLITSRTKPLHSAPPPGATEVVTSRRI